MTSRADRLLCCAVAYSNADISEAPIPIVNSSTDTEDHIRAMMNVIWFEAKENMSQPITDIPGDPYLHAVDIDSSEPGIVSSKAKLDIHRRKLPVPNVTYENRKPMKLYNVFEDLKPEISAAQALERAEKELQKKNERTQKKAMKEINAEQKSLEKIEKREESKRKRQNETPEEREERLTEMRERRAKKKEEKQQKELNEKIVAEEQASNTTHDENVANEVAVEKKLTVSDENEDISNISVNIQEMLEAEATADTNNHELMPPRVKARMRKAKFFASPVPFDRHLAALEATWPSQHVKEAVIDIIPDERVQIIQGPPGTGKTTELLHKLGNYKEQRIFMCAATNIGAANMYTRAVKMGYSCSLLMPQSRIPPGTPVTSQDPNARIVCSTISGRAGPILDAQKFEVVFVDEAAQCMEAWFWGLLRPEVNNIVMAGDVEQLPALVSEKGQKLGHDRSLMQRLMESKYPATHLNVQRRMHPEILALPNRLFYGNSLQTQYEASLEIPPYNLYNIKGKCEEIGTSFTNNMEAEFCVKQALKLKQVTKDVVILCPYQAQARLILSKGSNVEVQTIDSFQGREADIIILSMVRTDNIGFWADKRRLCVALTRAKHSLNVIGNCELWTGLLNELYMDALDRKLIREVS